MNPKRINGKATPEPSPLQPSAAERPPINPGRRLPLSSGALWLEDAWRGWIKQVFILLILLASAGLYYLEVISELMVTGVVGVLSALLPPLVAGRHRLGQLEQPRERTELLAWTVLACVIAPLWILGTVAQLPPHLRGTLDTLHRDLAAPAPLSASGPWEGNLLVRSQVERQGRFPFELSLESTPEQQLAGAPAAVSSSRTLLGTVRLDQSDGRGRQLISGAWVESSATRYRLETQGPPTVLRLVRKDGAIERLEVSLHPEWLPWRVLAGLSGMLILWGLWLDLRVSGAYARSWLVVSVTTTLPAGLMFYLNSNYVNLLKQWVGTGGIWAILGTAAGLALHSIGRTVVDRLP